MIETYFVSFWAVDGDDDVGLPPYPLLPDELLPLVRKLEFFTDFQTEIQLLNDGLNNKSKNFIANELEINNEEMWRSNQMNRILL